VYRIERVTLHEPSVWVNRDASGGWNWQALTPPPESDAPCPAIDIVHGTIVVHSVRTSQLPETSFACRSVNGRLVPSGHRRYAVRIVTDVDHAGALAINGSVDLKQKAWHLIGDIAALDTQQGALDVAAGLSPELREQVTALSEQKTVGDWTASPAGPVHPRPVTSTGARVPLRIATTSGPRSEFSLPELGVQAQLDVHFELHRAGAAAPVEYSVAATIHQGQIVNPALPVPLYNLRGRIRATQQQVVIEDVSAAAANGESQLRVSGSLERTASGWSKDLTIKAVNIALDPSVREYVHNETWRRTYDQVQPAGRFNLDVRVAHDGAARWDVTLNEFTAIECSLLHEQFQYPIQGIVGSVWQVGRDFQMKFDGFAGDRPVHLEGLARNPGPELEATLHITATEVPLDRRVLDALALPKYEKVRRALELLQLQGLANVDGTLRRPAGANQKFSLALHVDVHDGALNYMQFPYRITGLSGSIDYDPALTPIWFFRDLQGVHVSEGGDRSPVLLTSAESSFDLRQQPGELSLAINARHARIDKELHAACITASPSLNRIWQELSPAGMLDLDVDLRWQPGPGSKVDIRLPKIVLTDGRLKLRAIPLEWTNVNGTLSWRQGTATIESLYGEHGNTTLEIVTGPNIGTAVVSIEPQSNLDWHAHFEEIRIRRLVCDSELRAALPPGLANVIKSLDPQGPLDTDLSIDLKGASAPNETVTAQWSQRVLLPGNRITAGIVLDQATGLVQIVKGTWDGTAAVVEGFVNLAGARALSMPLERIRGPFTVDGNVVIIGTPDSRNPEWGLAAPVTHDPDLNQFRGADMRVDRFFADEQHAGKLGLNAVIVVDPENAENTQYRATVAVSDASLRAWARERKIVANKLRGAINGRLALTGRGSSGRTMRGNGFMKISDAELLDLPVFAVMMPMLNFKQAGQTLFNEGFADFELRDGRVIYRAIDLSGAAFRLVGKGNMEYTSDSRGELNLDFYTKADDQFLGVVGRLPLVSPLFDNWMHVKVTGTTDRPQVRQLPGNPAEYVRGLMQDIDKLQPQMMIPFAMPMQNSPQQQGMRPRPTGR